MVHFSMLMTRTLLRSGRLEVALEVLQQGHFLLEFLRVLVELILGQHVLLLRLADCLPFVVVEAASFILGHYFRRIIEEHSC